MVPKSCQYSMLCCRGIQGLLTWVWRNRRFSHTMCAVTEPQQPRKTPCPAVCDPIILNLQQHNDFFAQSLAFSLSAGTKSSIFFFLFTFHANLIKSYILFGEQKRNFSPTPIQQFQTPMTFGHQFCTNIAHVLQFRLQ